MSNIFLPKVVNIFCDASISKKKDGTYYGCPGAISVITDLNGATSIHDQSYLLLDNTTNNNSEITALLLGVLMASSYHYEYFRSISINIFSDSKISVFGLRQWIFNWLKNKLDGKMYSSSGELVANQEIFLKIVRIIVDNFMPINLYHQIGHVNVNKEDHLIKAKNGFKVSNNIDLEIDDVIAISNYNNYIDEFTRNTLTTSDLSNALPVLPPAIYYVLDSRDVYNYSTLIKPR